MAVDSNLWENEGEDGVLRLVGELSDVEFDCSSFSRVEGGLSIAVIRWFDGIDPCALAYDVPEAVEPRVGVLADRNEGELQDPGFVAMAEANCEGYRMSINN